MVKTGLKTGEHPIKGRNLVTGRFIKTVTKRLQNGCKWRLWAIPEEGCYSNCRYTEKAKIDAPQRRQGGGGKKVSPPRRQGRKESISLNSRKITRSL
jgi:hypothetical protein